MANRSVAGFGRRILQSFASAGTLSSKPAAAGGGGSVSGGGALSLGEKLQRMRDSWDDRRASDALLLRSLQFKLRHTVQEVKQLYADSGPTPGGGSLLPALARPQVADVLLEVGAILDDLEAEVSAAIAGEFSSAAARRRSQP